MLKDFGAISFVWYLAMLFFILLRNAGVTANQLQSPDSPVPNEPMSIGGQLLFGMAFALLMGVLHVMMDRDRRYKRMSYGRMILYQTLLYSTAFIVTITIVGWVVQTSRLGYVYVTFPFWLLSTPVLVLLVYVFVVAALIYFIRQVRMKFGPGNLYKMMVGTFHHPKEDERIFMFLDLRSSTMLAEQLGHIQYSRLLQDCFHDLAVVADYHAEVYQYVGDEAVLLWEVDKGIMESNCIRAFYAFQDRLQTNAEHYKERYGVVPEFKAGLNLGKVVVTEVGEIKREIAFHGDTMNTTARLEKKCNDFGTELLISITLKEQLREGEFYNMTYVGHLELEGKQTKIGVYSVDKRLEAASDSER